MESINTSKRIESILSATTFEMAVLKSMKHAANEADTSIAGYLSHEGEHFWKSLKKDLKKRAIGKGRRNAVIRLLSAEPETKAHLLKLYQEEKSQTSTSPIYTWKNIFETKLGYSFHVSNANIETFEVAQSKVKELFQEDQITDYEAFELMIGLAHASNKKAQRLSLKNSFWRMTLSTLHSAQRFSQTVDQYSKVLRLTDIVIAESGTSFKSDMAHALLMKLRIEAIKKTNTLSVLDGKVFWQTNYAQEQLEIIRNALNEADELHESKILGYDGPVRTTGLYLSAQQRILVHKNFGTFLKEIDEAIKIDDQEFETREWVLFDLEAKARVASFYGKEDDFESATREHNRHRLNSNIQLKHREEAMFQIHKQKRKAH